MQRRGLRPKGKKCSIAAEKGKADLRDGGLRGGFRGDGALLLARRGGRSGGSGSASDRRGMSRDQGLERGAGAGKATSELETAPHADSTWFEAKAERRGDSTFRGVRFFDSSA